MSNKVDFANWHKSQKGSRKKLMDKQQEERNKGRKTPGWVQRMKWFRTKELGTAWVQLRGLRKDRPWFNWHSKWVQIGEKNGKPIRRQIVANSRNGELPVPCVLYYYASQDSNPQLLATEQEAISLVDLHNYHAIPKSGRNGSTYYNYVRCKGRGRGGRPACQMCAEGVDTVFGQPFFWSLYPTAHRELMEQLEELNDRCTNCKTGIITTYAYKCASCGEMFGNHYEKEIPSDVEDGLKNMPVKCGSCDHEAMAEQVYECSHKTGRGDDATYSEGCGDPAKGTEALDIYNCDVKLAFDVVGKGVNVRVVDFRPATELPEELSRPMDLNEFLGKMDLEEQAKAMDRPNPFDDAAQKILDEYNPLPPAEEDHDSVAWDDDVDDTEDLPM